MIFEVAT